MIGMFLGLPRWLKLVGIGALVVIGLLIWLKLHTDAAIRDDRAKAAAEVAERSLAAERAAGAATEAIRAANESEAAKTREAMKEAEDANPEQARSAAGPVSRAAAERLRERARRSGAPSG